MRSGTSVRSHSKLHRCLLLLIVLELPLHQGVLVRLLLHIVLVEGYKNLYTCEVNLIEIGQKSRF